MKQRKVLVRYRYCHFHYIIIVLVIGSRGYETLVVGYGSFRGTTILRLILTGVRINHISLQG